MEDYYLGSQESSKGESSGSAISVAQAAENVGRDDVWVSGFIVGRSNMPELGSDQYPIMCYDLACPNCFDADNVAKNLILKDGGFVSCLRCGRTYNLNNQGIISDGEDGLKLYRYRATYSGSSFSIRN